MNPDLMKILRYAKTHVPYYTRILAPFELDENFTLNRFQEIPVLDRNLLFQEKNRFVSANIEKSKLRTELTSGSTGNFLTYYRTFEEHIIGGKILLNIRRQYCPEIDTLKGILFHPGKTFKDENFYYLSLINFSGSTIKKFLKLMSAVNAVWISGPCSVLFKLARFIMNSNRKYDIKGVKFIELNGEKVIEYQKKVIEEVFQCPVRNYYGCREIWGIAYECKENKLHVIGKNVYLETLNGTNELLITGYNNYAMPFIRYKVGDIGKVVRSRCPCGNPDDVIEELDGRINDYIQVNPDKSVHSSFIELIMTIIYTKGENLLQYQLIQHTLKEFTLKLCFDGIKDKKFVEDACYRWFKGLMGSKFRLTIDYVTNIRQNSKTGKFQYFISELIKP